MQGSTAQSFSKLFLNESLFCCLQFHLVKHSWLLSYGPAVRIQPMFSDPAVRVRHTIIESWTELMMPLSVIIFRCKLIFHLEVTTASGTNNFVLIGQAGLSRIINFQVNLISNGCEGSH